MDEIDILADRFGLHKGFLIGSLSFAGTVTLLVIFAVLAITTGLLLEGLKNAVSKCLHLYGTRRNAGFDQTLERRDEDLGGMEPSSIDGDTGASKDYVGEVPDVHQESSKVDRKDSKGRHSSSRGKTGRKRLHQKAGRTSKPGRKSSSKRVAMDKAIRQGRT